MPSFELPLNPFPETFSVSIANTPYRGRTRWNQHLSAWVLSLRTTEDAPLVENIPLVQGVNLLEQLQYLEICKGLEVTMDSSATDTPGFADLGGDAHVYVVTE